MPWILCGPGARPDKHSRRRRLDGDDPRRGLRCLEHLADAGDRPAGADTGDEDVDLAVERVEQISGPVVRRWASGLAGLENWSGRNASRGVGRRTGRVDRLVHAAERLGDLDPRAVEPQQALALAAHALRQVSDSS